MARDTVAQGLVASVRINVPFPQMREFFFSAGPTAIRGRPRVTRKYRERMCAQISGVGELSSATALPCVWLLLPTQALGLPS